MNTIDTVNLYADMAACLLALKNLLVAQRLVTHDEFVAAFQERALALELAGATAPLVLLRQIASGGLPPELDP